MNLENNASEHPKDRTIEPEDPMILEGESVPGDPWIMLEGLVEEYARMGWTLEMIEQLFAEPFFQATHSLYVTLGPDAVRTRIRETLGRCGVFRVQMTYAADAFQGIPRMPEFAESPTPDGARVPAHPALPPLHPPEGAEGHV